MSKELDFDLPDRFCGVNYLDTVTANIIVPEPLLKFYVALYIFGIDSFSIASKQLAKCAADFTDDGNECGVGVSEK